MTPDWLKELRTLREDFRRTSDAMLDAVPEPGTPPTLAWTEACAANAAARTAWVNALHDCQDHLLETAEEAARLRDAVSQYLLQIDTFGVANNGMVAVARKALREAAAPIPS